MKLKIGDTIEGNDGIIYTIINPNNMKKRKTERNKPTLKNKCKLKLKICWDILQHIVIKPFIILFDCIVVNKCDLMQVYTGYIDWFIFLLKALFSVKMA